MSEQIENPPAFPSNYKVWLGAGEFTDGQHEGMTLRDFFAAKSLPAIILQTTKEDMEKMYRLGDGGLQQSTARGAYMMADAMLAERTKGQPK